MSYNNYLKFFEKQTRKPEKALSFNEMLDIISKSNIDEKFGNNQQYAGGYSI